MNTKKTLVILLQILFISFQLYLLFIKNYQVLDYSRYINEFPQPLFSEGEKKQKLIQTFRAPGPLTRIDVMLGTYTEKLKGGRFQLGIYNDKQCLFLKNDPANLIKDNQFYMFLIPKDKIPAGSYSLILQFLPDQQEHLAVWTSRKDIYPYGNFFVNGKKQEGDMTFRVYYRSTLWKARDHLLEKIPSLWFSRFWLIIGLLLVLAALNFLFYQIVSSTTRNPFYKRGSWTSLKFLL